MIPWAEKYRPQSLDEVQGNDEIVASLQRIAKDGGNIPHCLFAGPPGTGKTSAAHALTNDILGENNGVVELNASDDRGIDVVRSTVQEYASTTGLDAGPFRVLILDEADNMTRDAQPALKRIMEKYYHNCRFILCVNDVEGVIEPIRDRCHGFFFQPIPDGIVFNVLDAIAQREGVEIDEPTANAIIARSRGSLRSAITFLQVVASGSPLPPLPEKNMSEIVREALRGRFPWAAEVYRLSFKTGPVGASDFITLVGDDLIAGKFQEHSAKVALALSSVELGRGKADYIQVMGFLARLGS